VGEYQKANVMACADMADMSDGDGDGGSDSGAGRPSRSCASASQSGGRRSGTGEKSKVANSSNSRRSLVIDADF
jgi:hypothetical protein